MKFLKKFSLANIKTAFYQCLTRLDLQNPLLVKYKFDPKEFVQGSSEAFKQVHRAIASMSFTNFVNGYVRKCNFSIFTRPLQLFSPTLSQIRVILYENDSI